MPNRSLDWLRQAERDWDQARDSRLSGRHEWTCFAAQQSAEKSVKALHLNFGQEAWGPVETFEKCSFLFKFKEGENFNHRNTLSISKIKI